MLSDDLGEKKIFTKGLEFLHVVFNVVEKRGPVFLSLVFASFSSYNLCKNTWLFLAMSLGVYLLNSKQADCLWCMMSKSNLTAYIERKSGNRLFTSGIVP